MDTNNSNKDAKTGTASPVPPPKPPRMSNFSRQPAAAAAAAVSMDTSGNKKIPPPVPPKRISADYTPPSPNSSRSSLERDKVQDMNNNNKSSSVTQQANVKANGPLSPVTAMHEPSRRESVSSLLSNSSLESYYNEIKQIGRQMKRQLLEDEDIMSSGNRINLSPAPPPPARRGRASSTSLMNLDEVVRKQQEQLFNSLSKLKQIKPPAMLHTDHRTNDAATTLPPLRQSTEMEESPANHHQELVSVDNELPKAVEPPKAPAVVYADEKRNHDFHALFLSVPADDRLIEEYNCAMFKDIVLQGKLYISRDHLCFNAKLFGWVTNLVIAFKDVKDIEKRTMALIVPNGIQITTNKDAKHLFASFITRDTTFDQIYQTWQSALSPHPEEQEEVQDPEVAQHQQPGETAVVIAHQSNKSSSSSSNNSSDDDHADADDNQDMDNKDSAEVQEVDDHYDWIIMDEAFKGTVEGLYELLFRSDFIQQYIAFHRLSQDLQVGAWDIDQHIRESIIRLDSTEYQVTDTETCHQPDSMICVSTTITKDSSTTLKCKSCITRKSSTEVQALISISDQQYIPIFKSFARSLMSNVTRHTIEALSEGKRLDTCWHPPRLVELQRKYVEPGLDIMNQTGRVISLSAELVCQYIQNARREHLVVFALLFLELLIILHMNQRVHQLEERQHRYNGHDDVVDALHLTSHHYYNESSDPLELDHVLFMQQKMDEIKQKISTLHQDISAQTEEMLKNSQETTAH